MDIRPIKKQLYDKIKNLLESSKASVFKNINHSVLQTYFEIGKSIVDSEQNGDTLDFLSKSLSEEFGKGFSITNLQQMKQFYIIYKDKSTADFKLSWSHYLLLMRMNNPAERTFYEIEATDNQWTIKELKRQFDSPLYERLVLSSDKNKVVELSTKGLIINMPQDTTKDPYILEFLGLEEKEAYSENELEQAIIDKLEHFLLELGKGFTFFARQKRISFDERHFYIDLVFYNRFLRCFLLIDLKIGDLKHQDLGQMQMYVNYYDREIRLPEENQTIGLILCKDKSNALVSYTLPEHNNQIFASKYEMILPSKEELSKLLQ